MEFGKYVRRPFGVEAVEVTAENIAEVAKLIGELQHKQTGTPYIEVDKNIVPNIFRVYIGWWVTKMGKNIRCYSRRTFYQQFVTTTPEIDAWVEEMSKKPVPSG